MRGVGSQLSQDSHNEHRKAVGQDLEGLKEMQNGLKEKKKVLKGADNCLDYMEMEVFGHPRRNYAQLRRDAVACIEGGWQNPASTAAAHVVGAVQAHAGRCSGGAAAGETLEVGPEAGVESPWAAQMEGPEIVWLKRAKKL